MTDVVTTAWAVVGLIFLYSVLLLFLEIELGPHAKITGGIGLGLSAFLGVFLVLVYGLPPDMWHFLYWFVGGFLSILLVVLFLSSLRWVLNITLG